MEKSVNVRKIAIACFIGGAICTAIGLLVNPMLAWLGTLAGFAAGYIAYDFREVLEAIPKALQESNANLCKKIEAIVTWGKERHPLIYSAVIAGYLLTICVMDLFLHGGIKAPDEALALLAGLYFFFAWLVMWSFSITAIAIAAAIGKALHNETSPNTAESFWDCPGDGSIKVRPMTYSMFLKWFLTGSLLGPLFIIGWLIAHTIKFCCYTFWLYLVAFIIALYQYIHSTERVCCGTYGSFGGTVAIIYGILAMPNRTPREYAFIVLCGGLLGAFTGATMGRKLVSKEHTRRELEYLEGLVQAQAESPSTMSPI